MDAFEWWGQAAWADIWSGALLPPAKKGSCAYYIEKLMKPDAHVNMETLGKIWAIMAKHDDDQVKETLSYLAGYLRRDPIRQFKTVTILYGMQAYSNKKLFGAIAKDEGWIAALAFIRTRAESGLNEEGDPLIRVMTKEIEKICIEKDNFMKALFKKFGCFCAKFRKQNGEDGGSKSEEDSDSEPASTRTREPSIDQPEGEPEDERSSSQPVSTERRPTPSMQGEYQHVDLHEVQQPPWEVVTLHLSNTEASLAEKPTIEMATQTTSLSLPDSTVPLYVPDEAPGSAAPTSDVRCDVLATETTPAKPPSSAVPMDVSETHTSPPTAETHDPPSAVASTLTGDAPLDAPATKASTSQFVGDELV
eukprot:GEMP01022727.1.p1 GENE.GEMP01022727.1~~GEMP01022727.1.p1  ORF type:complete len:363 (+),score=77.97 GEMP01022727.1:16-1104(+)